MRKLSQRDPKAEIQNALNLKVGEIEKLLDEKLVTMQNIIQQDKTNQDKNKELVPMVEALKNEITKMIQDASGQITVTLPPQVTAAKKGDKLKGGKGDDVPYSKMNKKQLEMGQKVEMEHTDDPEIAKEIAGDHLAEQLEEGKDKDKQDYYTLLEKIDPHEGKK
jgi:hypothetical protein